MAKTVGSRQRSGLSRRAGRLIDAARGPINATRVALKKMFGPLTPAERHELTAATKRLGRDVILSARARDNAGLEDFLMQEFFFDAPVR